MGNSAGRGLNLYNIQDKGKPQTTMCYGTVHSHSVCACISSTTLEICQPPCVNGRCNVNTGLCDCSPGYTGASCGEGKTLHNYNSSHRFSPVIRHCDEDNVGCDQICTDFPGGYSCSCRAGYSLLTSDGTSCMGRLMDSDV